MLHSLFPAPRRHSPSQSESFCPKHSWRHKVSSAVFCWPSTVSFAHHMSLQRACEKKSESWRQRRPTPRVTSPTNVRYSTKSLRSSIVGYRSISLNLSASNNLCTCTPNSWILVNFGTKQSKERPSKPTFLWDYAWYIRSNTCMTVTTPNIPTLNKEELVVAMAAYMRSLGGPLSPSTAKQRWHM